MENSEDEMNEFLDSLLDKDRSDAVVSEMNEIKEGEDGDEESAEDLQEEKGLFEISEEELFEYDREVPFEKYAVEKNYETEEESTEDDGNEVGEGVSDEEGSDEYDKLEKELYGENDEEEDDDDGNILDPNDPDLRSYKGDDQGVTAEELSAKKEVSDEEEYEGRQQKKSFDELNGSGRKKIFEPGKLNKNNMILFICGFLGLLMLGFWWATREKEKKNSKSISEDNVNINDYSPDFGDYKARAYREEETNDEENEAYDKIDDILYKGEKEEFKKEEKPVVQSYSSGQKNVQSVPQDDVYTQRVTSSIRKGINPKDYVNYGYPVNTGSGGGYGYNNYAGGSIPSATDSGGYFDQLGQITSSLTKGSGQNATASVAQQSSSLRYSDAGRYVRDKEGGDYSSIPANSIYPGYIIPAVLVSGINTDYPGDITARVTSNVYDSRTGSVLLIPAGSILRGSYSSSSIGISRIQIAWQTLIINRDGVDYMVNLGSMVGVDSKGYSGIGGSLNDHYFEYLKAAGLASLFTYINSSIYSVSKAQKNRVTAQMIDDSQEIGNKLADKLLDRALDIAPTVTVKGGTRINVDVNRILTLQPYERDMPKQRYKR